MLPLLAATRIIGIDFSIEDPTPFMSQLRHDAVRDALARAEHLAELTGIAVGDLIFIGEVGQGRLWLEAMSASLSRRGSPSTRRPPSGSGS